MFYISINVTKLQVVTYKLSPVQASHLYYLLFKYIFKKQ